MATTAPVFNGLTIDILAQAGLDALGNHFEVILPTLPGVGSVAQTANLNLRVLTIDIPAQGIGTYEIRKRGRKLIRPSGISDQELEVTFSYRVDKYFQVYSMISQYLAYIQNPITMSMASDSGTDGTGGASQYRMDITVLGIDTNGVLTGTWVLKGAWFSNQSNLSFEEESGDPLTCDVTIQCNEIVYPGIATS